MEKETKPKFIEDALVIITADKLGIEVNPVMLDMSRKIWGHKKGPSKMELLEFNEEVIQTENKINNRRLESMVRKIVSIFYQTGDFPSWINIKENKDYVRARVLRDNNGDGTNGGISSTQDNLWLFDLSLSYQQVNGYCEAKGIDKRSVLKLMYYEQTDYIYAEPIIDRGRFYMNGGNFIYSSDPRFYCLTDKDCPIAIHDRTEPHDAFLESATI